MKKTPNSLARLSEKVVDIPTSQKIIILVLTILLIGAGFYYLVYQDNSTKIDRLKKDIKSMESRLAILKKKSRQLKKLQKEVAEARKQLKVVSNLLPKRKEIPSLLDGISRCGTETLLEFILFKPEKEVQKDFYAEIPISIVVRGTYHQVAMFLSKLSHLERIVTARNLSMKTVGKIDEGVLLEAKCKAVTYRFVEKPKKSKKPKRRKR